MNRTIKAIISLVIVGGFAIHSMWLGAAVRKLQKDNKVVPQTQVIREYVYLEPEVKEEDPVEIAYSVYEKPQDVSEWISGTDFSPIDCTLPLDLQEYTYFVADNYHIDFYLLMAIMWKESRYTPDVVSRGGDYGLMQINKRNHEWLTETLGLDDITDPKQNIEAGAYVLWMLYEKYDGNTHMALMSYNMGEGNARKLWNQGVYESNYSRSVIAKQEELANGNN